MVNPAGHAHTVIQLTLALDLLTKRRKVLKFLTHCSASTYLEDAMQELAVVDTRIETLQRRRRLFVFQEQSEATKPR